MWTKFLQTVTEGWHILFFRLDSTNEGELLVNHGPIDRIEVDDTRLILHLGQTHGVSSRDRERIWDQMIVQPYSVDMSEIDEPIELPFGRFVFRCRSSAVVMVVKPGDDLIPRKRIGV